MWCQPSDVVADRLDAPADAPWRLRCRRCGWRSRQAPDRDTCGWMRLEHIARRVPRHRHIDRMALEFGADLLDVAATSEASCVDSDALSGAAWRLRQAAVMVIGRDGATAVPVDALELLGAVGQLAAASPGLRTDRQLDADFHADVAQWTRAIRQILGVGDLALPERAA